MKDKLFDSQVTYFTCDGSKTYDWTVNCGCEVCWTFWHNVNLEVVLDWQLIIPWGVFSRRKFHIKSILVNRNIRTWSLTRWWHVLLTPGQTRCTWLTSVAVFIEAPKLCRSITCSFCHKNTTCIVRIHMILMGPWHIWFTRADIFYFPI